MTVATLVVHTGGIGDFLLMAPVLPALGQAGPVDLAGYRGRLELAVAAGLARAAYSLDAVGFDSVFTTPTPGLRSFLCGYGRAVVWMRDDDGRIAGVLQDCGIPQVAVYPGLPPPDWSRHAAAYYAECLGMAEPPPLRLAISPGPRSHDVVIHPGSGGRHKNWPTDRYATLARRLLNDGHRVAWCRGPAEADCPVPPGCDLLAIPGLIDLAGVLAAARLYIGNDSGISHLAAAVGCKVAVLFGPTDPRVWAPRGHRVCIIQADAEAAAPWPDVQSVYEIVAAFAAEELDP